MGRKHAKRKRVARKTCPKNARLRPLALKTRSPAAGPRGARPSRAASVQGRHLADAPAPVLTIGFDQDPDPSNITCTMRN